MSTPLKINGKHLYQIMLTTEEIAAVVAKIAKPENEWSQSDIDDISTDFQLYPTEVMLVSETYSRNAERTADYELEQLQLINRKAKPEFTWSIVRATYVQRLMQELQYTYDFKQNGVIIPVDAPTFAITYIDFTGERTINTYLGQTIDGTLVEYNGVQYWQNFRIAFPER